MRLRLPVTGAAALFLVQEAACVSLKEAWSLDSDSEGLDSQELDLQKHSHIIRAAGGRATSDGPPVGRKPVMWVHVHKNAGSTMCIWARLHAGERCITPWENCNSIRHGDDWIQHGIATQRSWTTCANRSATFKQGNFTWGQIERELSEGDVCLDDFIYGISLRDPVNRIMSYVNGNSIPNHKKWLACVEARDFAACPPKKGLREKGQGYEHFDNFLVRTLGGYDVMTLPPGGVNMTHTEAALSLLKKFDLVVLLEQINTPAAQAAMDRVLGWHPEGAPLGAYKFKYPFKKVELQAEDEASIRALNKFDYIIYDHFSKLGASGAA